MRVLLLFAVILIITISSCGSKDEYNVVTVKGFPSNIDLYGERVPITDMPLCGSEVWIIDTLLLLKNEAEECGDPYFFVYDINTLDLLVKFGDHGRGPEEFINVSYLGQYCSDNVGLKIILNNRTPKGILVVDLSTTIEEGKTVLDSSLLLPEELVWAFDYYMLSDSSFLGRGMMIEGRFFHYNNGSMTLSPFYPELPREIPSDFKHNLYAGRSSLSRDNDLFASALIFFKQIDVYSPELTHKYSIRFPDSPDDIDFFRDEAMGADLDYFYRDIHVSDNYIYALYHGVKYNEADSKDYGHSEIHLFNRQGEPLAKYTLNHTLYSITSTDDDRFLYGIAGFQGDDTPYLPVVRFYLPEL